jgi:oligoendopeptidase F
MGLDALRPWDVGVDPQGRPPLRPFEQVDTLVEGAARIFHNVEPTLGGYFDTLSREQLLDLESRIGKAPGGYCQRLDYRKRPFIFMNAVGLASDVETLVHESGHAFHVFETAALPLLWQRSCGIEMAEVASMSMELLAAPYLDQAHGGYYAADDYRRARAEHLEGILLLMAHIASVDAFQHWIYTDPAGADRDARDAAWLRIRSRFEQGIDWSGLEAERVARWYRQIHIFQYPFYYVEYGIAQLGALQIWRNSLKNQDGAVAGYRRALALGGTRPLPELFAAAGARLLFDTASLQSLVEMVESALAEFEG